MLHQAISKTTVHQAKRPRRLITLMFQYALSLLLVFAFIFPLLLLVNNLPNLSVSGGGIALTQGWFDTYQVQIIPFITSAFSIFLFYQFFKGIPVDLDEAALVDGASYFQIYRRIIMPNSGPVIATVAIFTFLGSWTSF